MQHKTMTMERRTKDPRRGAFEYVALFMHTTFKALKRSQYCHNITILIYLRVK